MNHLRRLVIPAGLGSLLMTALLSLGCDSSSEHAGGCLKDGETLVMSWDSYCEHLGDCTAPEPAPPFAWKKTSFQSCGLVVYSLRTEGGLSFLVYDSDGKMVGAQRSSDGDLFQCPSEPSLRASSVRAGRSPDPTCAPAGDGGATDS